MHHYRVNVNGPAPTVGALVAELGRAGARPVEPSRKSCLVMASEDGIETWEALSRRHPAARLGLECFTEFEDDLHHIVIENGQVTVMACDRVLPDDWGSFHDEDGERLDQDLLRAAAESIAAQRDRHDVGTMADGLDIALTMGKALGRLCGRVEPSVFENPPREAVEAITELAVFALFVSASSQSSGAAERDFDHALRLTQSMVHAGRSEFRDKPGDACWSEWLGILIGAASNVIDAACDCRIELESESQAFGSEHYQTAAERLEVEARALLTTCVEALALFGAGAPEPM